MAKMMVKERSLSDIFDEAKDAWRQIENGELKIRDLRSQIKMWRDEIEDAKSRLAKILGREEEPWERDDEEET